MKKIINKSEVKKLLSASAKSQKDLAEFIGYPESNLSACLGSGERNIPMGYVFSIASFLKVKPLSIAETEK